jgi:hypothetical protein
VLERVPLTANESTEVDQVVVERDFVLGLQIPAVERRIVRAETSPPAS